ncbi:ribosome biogenesis GTP-binding protein YihA/YsxC [Candidatus Hepatoplasma crinochetorum]|uniref:Probable GTP-binding protein EngB n=1 Tax=Candidatus Hepatoplasma crinochetorum Av TaxID=1427984 RepID=W8GFH9_9MOLU|nr:ribosome biogenesis GTP-binding protein YihA/YsxC [Candidatus Hepatoplasma crinochetorum]AHK22529.1 putative GTP-binding protein EngB [Candidatus Hepatoplasma crinochetorum Av]BDV03112.1 MAG: putative GTP-binding protein EngB [Candidatus Hepatoplasma crinochetorum]
MNDQLDNNNFLKNVKYLLTTDSLDKMPNDNLKEIVIIGRSNVGKSTFINTIANNKQLAKKSNKAGKTRAISFFDVDNKFRLVDIPGYGYANVSKKQLQIFSKMLGDYFSKRNNLDLAILLLDIRRKLSNDDFLMISYLQENKINYQIVATKLDKVNQKEKAAFIKEIKIKLNKNNIILYSAINKTNLRAIKNLFSNYF